MVESSCVCLKLLAIFPSVFSKSARLLVERDGDRWTPPTNAPLFAAPLDLVFGSSLIFEHRAQSDQHSKSSETLGTVSTSEDFLKDFCH